MGLVDKQALFAQMAALLIIKAGDMGYAVTLGEAYRSPAEARRLAAMGSGIAGSLHCDRLAIDLCLFRGGVYLTATADYEPLGIWWEGKGGAWGGRFGDGNHFSLENGGRK